MDMFHIQVWKQINSKSLFFSKLLNEVIRSTVKKSTLQNEYHKCGLYLDNPIVGKIAAQKGRIEISDEKQLP